MDAELMGRGTGDGRMRARVAGRTLRRRSASNAPRRATLRAPRTLQALVLALVAVCSAATPPGARAASAESEARAALEGAFRQLRAGDYGGLYEALPAASRRRVTRARFVAALERARGMYELDRLEINAVSVAGDLAVADATVYGRARTPIEAEGKIVARQYLVREGGRWRVTTGEASTVRPLLAAHPAFARKYPPREPRLYLKRDGRWVDMTQTLRGVRRRVTR